MGAAALTAVFMASMGAPAWAAPAPQDNWKRIEYLPIAVPWSMDGNASVSLQPDAKGLRLDVLIATDPAQADDLPAKGVLRARLHREPEPTAFVDLESRFATSSFGPLQWDHLHVFPWGQDQLADTWLELQVDERTFWLEIPYGLDREPGPASADAAGPSGGPKFAAAMGELPEDAVIVPWRHVRYEIGEIQNVWHLTVLQSNPFDATTELKLYRQDGEVGRSMFLWGLHEPRTAVSVSSGGQHSVDARCMQLRLHPDGMRRSDTFALSRNSSEDRGWGTMKISVGEHEYELVLPSSLYRYTHGVAEPHHLARIR